MSDNLSIFRPGKNCWKTGMADHAAILVDSSNYYGALYEAISKAQRSIFVLGWDIDSRIKLKRGEDSKGAKDAVTFFELICSKARENPDLQIYLNRWDYSLFFMGQREPFWVRKWKRCGLKNIHVCLDGVVPLAACHHQKVVVIDDEVAFWGGMDVALGRWDWRQHHVNNPYRADPSGLPAPKKKMRYGPYHDIQAVIAGPIVSDYARLVRDRWRLASSVKPLPLSQDSYKGKDLPQAWPDSFRPQFSDIPVALARTVPAMPGHRAVQEGLKMFVDVIAQAENFIYIENQYLACDEIAEALNRQLQEKPGLRLLAVSCDRPQGIMERKSMWGGRVVFRDILEKGGVGDRFELVYPASKEGRTEKSIHIHSKMLIIDDKFLHLGSSNIANRSMGMDTEFDVTLTGDTPESRKAIAAIRNDLIREHCGREIKEIQNVIDKGQSVNIFAEELKTSRQHLRRLDDAPYRNEPFVKLVRAIADPKQPIIPMAFTHILHRRKESRFAPPVTALLCIFAVVAVIFLGWKYLPLDHYGSIDQATAFLKRLSASPWSLFYATGLYAIGSAIFFPLTALTGACVAVFGPMKGVVISFTGAMISSLIGFAIGRLIGVKRLEAIFGKKISKVMNKIRDTGIVAVTLIRLLPIAPYPLVNMVFGVAGVPLNNFIIGTIFGLIPGKIALAVAGDGIFKVFEHPDPKNIAYLCGGLLLWLAMMLGTQKIAQRFSKRSERSA